MIAPKPKKKRAPKAKAADGLAAEQLSALIGAMSDVIASRAGDHWKLSKAECMTIAEPAAKMVNNSEQLKQLAEHSDAFALVTACIIVFAPRIMITAQTAKQRKVKHNAAKSSKDSGKISVQNPVRNEEKPRNPDPVKSPVPYDGGLGAEIDLGT